jgi:acyl-CoA synthetase (AMP-forming)/AMP-acid ligase II
VAGVTRMSGRESFVLERSARLVREWEFAVHGLDASIKQRWRAAGYWPDIALDAALDRAAQSQPHARLTIHSANRPADETLASLRRGGLRIASALRELGLKSGDVVALQLPNWIETALIYQAAAALGCVILPIVPIFGPTELGFILRNSRARALFIPSNWRKVDYVERFRAAGNCPDLNDVVVVGGPAPKGFLDWDALQSGSEAFAPANPAPDDPAFMVYTSGTTAEPKGVIHTSNTLLAEVFQSYPPEDTTARVLSPYPAGHIAGALGILAHAVAGRPTVLFDTWDPIAAVGYIASNPITHTAGTPFHYLGLLDAAEAQGSDLSSLRSCGTGGATVPESLVERAERLGVHLFRRYGMTEHPTVTQGADGDPLHRRMTTDGRARAGVELRIVDDDGNDLPSGAPGEVATRGPDMFVGYSDPALTKAAMLPGGWYLSGDIGIIDADGCLTIVDRKKDIVIRGGENISSREIEDLVLRVPGVSEAAAVGMPDARLGERICVYVIIRDGVVLDLAAVQAAFTSFGVARQKTPERLIVATDLPRTAAGKIKKAELREDLRREAAQVENSLG